MAELATLKLVVSADGAIRAVDQFGNAATSATKKTAALEKAVKVAGVALVGFAALALRKVVKESEAAQFAQAQLEAAIKSTGAAAGLSVRQLNAQAAAFQKLTTQSDDAVTAMQGVLLTFTKIHGPEFTRASAAILDLSARMGIDLKSAALQVGKALNDPAIGLTALTRSGVSFTQAQKDVIIALFETGQQAKAQAMILQELEVEFGGSAKAARDTLGGALKALGHEWDNLFEVSREQSSGIIFFIEKLTSAVPKLRDVLNDTVQGWRLLWVDMQASTTIALAKMERDIAVFGKGGAGAVLFGLTQGKMGTGLMASAAIADAEFRTLESQVQAWAEEQRRAIVVTDQLTKAIVNQANAVAASSGGSGRTPTMGGFTKNVVGRNGAGDGWRMGVPAGSGSRIGAQMTPQQIAEAAAQAQVDAAAAAAATFREGMQRNIASFFSDFLTQGGSAVKGLFSGFQRLGADIIGQTLARALTPKVGSMGMGGSLLIGAVMSTLGGAVSHFLDAGDRARAMAEAFKTATRSIADFAARATETDDEAAIRRLREERDQLARQAAGALGFKFTGGFDDIQREAQRLAGGSGLGSIGGVSDQARKLLEALAALAAGFEANTDAMEEAVQASHRATAAERVLSLARSIEGLQGFTRDLRRSDLSIYSPFQQQEDARARYEEIVAKARSGDQSAADQLPAAARAFLESSRSINASGSRYVADFQRVERETADVTRRFEAEKTQQQRIADGTDRIVDGMIETNRILERTDTYVQQQVTIAQQAERRRDTQTTELIDVARDMARRLGLIEERLAPA